MKLSEKIMSFVMALSLTTAMVPQASAQTQPANSGAPQTATPAQKQTPAQQQQKTHSRAKGAAAGAAVGGTHARHARREERRITR
jgi:hypothetical protein